MKQTRLNSRSSLSEKVRFVRTHMRNMVKHTDRASTLGRAAVISAWHAGKGLVVTRSSDGVSEMKSPDWGDFCNAKFGLSAARANNLMKLPEAFGAPDDIPDECDSVAKAVKAARAVLRTLRPARLRPKGSNKSIEKGMKDWLVHNWSRLTPRQRARLGVPYPAADRLHAEVPVHGRSRGKPVSGAIDLLARHVREDRWTIMEAKAGLSKESDLSQLLLYARLWQANPGARKGSRIDLVFLCEDATPGLVAAAAGEGIVLVKWGYSFGSFR